MLGAQLTTVLLMTIDALTWGAPTVAKAHIWQHLDSFEAIKARSI